MAVLDSTHPPAAGNPVRFVASDPLKTPVGYGSGTLAAEKDFGAVALIIDPPRGRPTLRLLIDREGALALACRLVAAADELASGGPCHG